MSRTSTATPPAPYFPQRTLTPTMRHAAASSSIVHFAIRQPHHPGHKRKVKQLPPSLGGLSPAKKAATPADSVVVNGDEPLGFSFEQVSPKSSTGVAPIYRAGAAASMTSLTDSTTTSMYDSILGDMGSTSNSRRDGRTDSIPSMTSSTADSFLSTNLPTPAGTDESFDLQQEVGMREGQMGLGLCIDTVVPPVSIVPCTPTPARASWVPNFGRMAKAVVTGFGDRKQRKELTSPRPPSPLVLAQSIPVPSVPALPQDFLPHARYTRPPLELIEGKSEAEVQRITREWCEAEHKRIHECAKLCSQFPQSGYNLAKWGPNGAPAYYEPQCSANPDHVQNVMQRQAELERLIRDTQGTFFPASRGRDSCDSDTEPSIDSYDSSLPSPTASMFLSADDALAAATAANLRAAMASPLIGGLPNASQVSLLFTASPKSIKGARSLTELDMLASSMALSKDDGMEVDGEVPSLVASEIIEPLHRIFPPTRPVRAQSCGSKRPLVAQGAEEDKRRRVDEAMVLEEAVDTGVIMPPRAVSQNPRMSASTPDLSSARSASVLHGVDGSPAVFGHVVKTSDTHPIIISPFFPDQLLPILAEHLIMPPSPGPWSNAPFLLKSDIDVPSLLLSCGPPALNAQSTTIVPSPVQSSFPAQMLHPQKWQTPAVGNLLLSSCPGKRLRMEGPVKKRGPICRDLATDLRRIKGEGVGCIVCCLDDAELALLGVPWETYREVAADTGLDVIRLPMPDGFTPVSIPLFDSEVTLIATKYSLRGINVLVHCRGGVGRAGLTACAWAIKMGFVQPHPSLAVVEEAALRQSQIQSRSSAMPPSSSSTSISRSPSKHAASRAEVPAQLEHQIVMSVVERVIAMIRSRRGLKAIESFEQVQFLAAYVRWLRAGVRGA